MKQKNRFSNLLEHLMVTAELKNATLARELQYDVSYISKWLAGQLPSAKTEEAVMTGISRCVVRKGSEAGRKVLYDEYQVATQMDLEGSIYDHLMAEYAYVRNTQKDSSSAITPKTLYFPNLDMRQYILRMNHPVLRRVKSLNIMALMDLMAMDREYRMQIARIESGNTSQQWRYPDVHFSMIIDLDTIQNDYVHDVVFLLNMLTDMTRIDFRLYGSRTAYGRAVFAVENEFSISGMLTRDQDCMSVVITEDAESSNILYNRIRVRCTRERMLLRKSSMEDLMLSNDYARSLIATNQRMLFGHLTEQFVPPELLETIIADFPDHTETITEDRLRWVQSLARERLGKSDVKMLFYESALSEFAVNGVLDFFNVKIRLTPAQRLQYMSNLRDLIRSNSNLSVKLIFGLLFTDFQYNSNQYVFLSDGISYLSLDCNEATDSLHIINNKDMYHVFSCFFDEVWNDRQDVVVSDREIVLSYIDHIVQQIQLIADLET